jgi:hypothetical protein
MRLALAYVVGICLALFLGLGSAWLAVRSPTPIDAITIGVWQAWPNAGTDAVDPYSRARLSRTGEIPLGSGEGLALFARTDDAGEPLHFFCDYSVIGQTPPARLWTMVVERDDGGPLGRSTAPHALGSDGIVRAPDGNFVVSVSRSPRPGNWISSQGAGRFRLVVRLYDTTARSVTGIQPLVMPRIRRDQCA